MDQRLFEATIMGDVVALKALQKEDKLILRRVSLSSTAETPLHVASLAGHVDFVREIMKLVPSFAQELNKDGFAPIHLATAAGHLEVAKELLSKADSDLCLLKDKAGRTALHLAAIKGRVHIMNELLSKCPHQKAMEQVTPLGETVLHLAVKNSQFEAFKVMFEASEKLEGHEERVNAKDNEGKTVLEIANATNQLQVLDFLNQHQNREQIIMVEDDTQPDRKAEDKPQRHRKSIFLHLKNIVKESWGMYLKDKDLLPVMATLIAAATFQAGLNPPSIIWEKGIHLDTKCINSNIARLFKFKDSWRFALCPASRFYVFMVCNTIAFASSLALIPYHQHVLMAPILTTTSLYFMLASYVTALVSISSSRFFYIFADVVMSLSLCLLIAKPVIMMSFNFWKMYPKKI